MNELFWDVFLKKLINYFTFARNIKNYNLPIYFIIFIFIFLYFIHYNYIIITSFYYYHTYYTYHNFNFSYSCYSHFIHVYLFCLFILIIRSFHFSFFEMFFVNGHVMVSFQLNIFSYVM